MTTPDRGPSSTTRTRRPTVSLRPSRMTPARTRHRGRPPLPRRGVLRAGLRRPELWPAGVSAVWLRRAWLRRPGLRGAGPGRAGPAGPRVPSGTFGNRGYTMPGQQDGQYQEYAYGQQDQQDASAAQARGQQGFAAQPSSAAPQWQDAVRAGQSRRRAGVRGGRRPASTLSAPVPPDHGAGGQQSPGTAAAASFTGQQGGGYGTPVPEADRYAASYGEQPGYAQPGGYQAAQQDAARYPSADTGHRDGAGSAPSGYAAGAAARPGRGDDSLRPAPTGMTSRRTPVRVTLGRATVKASAAARGPSPAGTPRRALPPAPAGTPRRQAPTATRPTGTRATGTRPASTRATSTRRTGTRPTGTRRTSTRRTATRPTGAARAPTRRLRQAAGSRRRPARTRDSPRTVTRPATPTAPSQVTGQPTGPGRPRARFRRSPLASPPTAALARPGEAGGTGRAGQPAGAGNTQMPGYGASPPGGSQAYQVPSGYANGNGAAYPANGNGYAQASANGNGYASQNGAPHGQRLPARRLRPWPADGPPGGRIPARTWLRPRGPGGAGSAGLLGR